MKRILFLTLISLGSWPALAQSDHEQRVQASLQQATVFLNRAQLTAQARATLEAGTTRLIIDNAAAQTDPQSIQVSGKGDAVIQGVQFRTNFLTKVSKPAALQRLEDSLRTARQTFETLTLELEVLENEKRLVLANQKVGGDKGATVKEVVDMADFYRKRLTEIGQKMLVVQRQLREQKQRVDRLEGQVNEQNARRNRPVGEIEVTLTARTRTVVDLNLSYVVAGAGWSPVYDIRVKNTKSPASIAYRAYVYQNTGFDWENVRLSLSTANPALSGTQPDLGTQYVSFYEPRPVPMQRAYSKAMAGGATDASETAVVAQAAAAPTVDLANTAQFTQVEDQPLNVSFNISIPYSILTNSRPQLVDIQTSEIPARYRYSASPKVDTDAFLVAVLSGWEKLNLLNGVARVYFEGTYVGESQLNLRQANAATSQGDSLVLSLGRDKRILVQREKMTDFSSRKTLGSNVRDTYGYRITVRNTKNEPVQLTLYDQIPVSTDSRIEVSLEDAGGAVHHAETGRLTWNLMLQPNESRTLTFRYEVKYPKGRTLTNAE
ncbi:hypothetical protein GCM10023189_20970 [Nibrella saemangeumensis]|uniref:Mucoidy inhibitor MuiA family protein n=1 Tax=Nibrella saemangeumensis TaxID=1084526 RepID=A0ABP8MQG5_9BACT